MKWPSGTHAGSTEYSWTNAAGRPAIDRHAEKVRDAVVVRRRGDRLTVGRPSWSALQVERIGHNPRVRAIGLHYIQECLPVLPDRESDIPPVGRDCRAAKDSRSRATPQLCAGSVGKLPDAFARARRRNIQKIIWTQPGRRPRAGRQRDSSRRRCFRRAESRDPQTPERSFRACECENQTSSISAGRQRRVPVKSGGQPVGNAALDVHAIKPRTRTIGIASEVH